MGRSTGNFSGPEQGSSRSRLNETHYIWRGIGCLMIIILPVMSIASANETVNYGIDNGWPIPYEMLQPVRLPDIFYSTGGLRTIFNPLSAIPHFYAVSALSVLYLIFASGLISVIYAAVYRMVGPSKYGPTDAPPTKFKATKKSR